MADPERTAGEGPSGTVAEARSLAEQAMHAQAAGQLARADQLLTRAQELDPDTVAEVLREHDAGRTPDARLQDLANQDVEKVPPRIKPGPA